MEARAAAIAEGRALERVWLVEHPPLYTAGTSAKAQDLVARSASRSTARDGRAVHLSRPRGSGWPTSCSTSTGAGRTCEPTWPPSRPGWIGSTPGRRSRCGASAGGPGRRLGAPAGEGAGRRGQDRGDRHPGAALGDLPRRQPERRAGPVALLRHRAVRRARARRHQPRRSRPPGHPAGGRRGVLRGRFEAIFGPTVLVDDDGGRERRGARASRFSRRPDLH